MTADRQDSLSPVGYLVTEVLAARWRLGERMWTFPTRLRTAVERLTTAGLVEWKAGIAPRTVQVWLTDAGRKAVLSDTYEPPGPNEETQNRPDPVHGLPPASREMPAAGAAVGVVHNTTVLLLASGEGPLFASGYEAAPGRSGMTGQSRDDRFRLVAAVHLLLLRGGRLLMARRCNTGYEDGSWSVPAGHVDGGEPFTAAAAREAREEVGLDLHPEHLHAVHVMHRAQSTGDEWVNVFLTSAVWSGEPVNAEPGKCSELGWFPLDDLPPGTIPYVAAAVAAWRSGRFYSEYGWQHPHLEV